MQIDESAFCQIRPMLRSIKGSKVITLGLDKKGSLTRATLKYSQLFHYCRNFARLYVNDSYNAITVLVREPKFAQMVKGSIVGFGEFKDPHYHMIVRNEKYNPEYSKCEFILIYSLNKNGCCLLDDQFVPILNADGQWTLGMAVKKEKLYEPFKRPTTDECIEEMYKTKAQNLLFKLLKESN